MEDFSKNTWIGGMNRDISKSKFSDTNYYELRNAHFITHEGLSTGSIENEKGTELILALPSIPSSTYLGLQHSSFSTQVDPKILGWKFYRNDLIVISSCSDGEDNIGHIWLIPFDQATGTPVAGTISVYSHLRYVGSLNLNSNYRVRKIIPRYEYGDSVNGGVYKIYWTDAYNNLRHLNLYDSANYHTGSNIIDIDPSLLEIRFNLGSQQTLPIALVRVRTGGTYKAGMNQYAYQVYNPYGVESKFLGYSKLIHITKSNEYAVNSSTYFGSSEDEDCNKAVEISIPAVNTSLFSKIRVISLHYKAYYSTPEVSIVYDGSSSSTAFNFIDTGASLGTLVSKDVVNLNVQPFSPKDIEVKNNRLIAANITTESTFDILQFDTRAYRFNSARIARLYTDNTYIDYLAVNGSSPDWTSVPVTHNCINSFNEIKQGNDADLSKQYMYQANGTTLGGEGENIKFEFIRQVIEIDEGGESYTSTAIEDLEMNLRVPQSTSNPSFTSYASPYVHANFRGYMRDEIYAYGIVWLDDYGNESFASWICDVRFPRIYDTASSIGTAETMYRTGSSFIGSSRVVNGTPQSMLDYRISFRDYTTKKTYGVILGIKFTLKNIPSGVTAYKIVRCERTALDRTIAFQGMLQSVIPVTTIPNFDDGTTSPGTSWLPASDLIGLTYSAPGPFTVISPELSFFPSDYNLQSEDFIALSACYFGPAAYFRHKLNVVYSEEYYKFVNMSPSGYASTVTPRNRTYSILAGSVIPPEDITVAPNMVGNWNYINYNANFSYTTPFYNVSGPHGTVGVFEISGATPQVSSLIDHHFLVNYKRKIIPYKGNTYQARLQREYISCSNITAIGTATIDVYDGDTYVSMYSYLKNMVDDKQTPYLVSGRKQKWLAFPVETRINLDIRTDKLLGWTKRIHGEIASVTQFAPSSGYNATAIGVTQGSKTISFNNSGIGSPLPIGSLVKIESYLYKVTQSSPTQFSIHRPFAGTGINKPIFFTETDTIHTTYPYGGGVGETVYRAGLYSGEESIWFLREKKEEGLTRFPESYPLEISDLYLYNSVYSKDDNVVKSFPKPDGFKSITTAENKIQASLKGIYGSSRDQWLVFQPDTYNNVDPIYGGINALQLFREQLFFFQDTAFGIQPIDERITVPDESGNKMILGDGDVVGRYGYISRITGCISSASIVATENQIHFFDVILRRWNVYTGESPLPLSVVGGMSSYFNSKISDYYTQLQYDKLCTSNPSGIHGVLDIKHNRVLMTFLAESSLTPSENYVDTIVFNLTGNCFEQFIDFYPSLYCNVGNYLISIDSTTFARRGYVYRHDTGDYGQYYNNTTRADVKLKFWSNKYPDNTKIYTFVEFNCAIFNNTEDEAMDALGNPEVFDIFRMVNDYQSTGFKKLRVFEGPNSTIVIPNDEIEVRRRFRTWRFKVPRSMKMREEDRADARMRSQYAMLEFIWTNNLDKRLILYDISTFFTGS